jgi:hypothetical protein
MLVEAVRDGGFWKPDAFVVAVASIVLLCAQMAHVPHRRRSWLVIGSLTLLAAWWFVRAAIAGTPNNFLPLGASLVGFAFAFAAVHTLTRAQRAAAGLFVAALGAAGSLVGFAGLIWRWYPMAMPAQNLWRLSTTLTYADAAGAFLAMCLLVALAGGPRPWLSRAAVCLCAGGLIAAQSRGALLAFACACAFVPWRQYAKFLVPLVAGVALGVVAVATSPSSSESAWLAVALIVALATSLAWVPRSRGITLGRGRGVLLGALALGALVGAALLVRSEIALRALAPSDQDRAVEWSAALHQFESHPWFGVGPDRLLHFHAADGTLANFAHNEYLQVAADAGVVGLLLLVLAGSSLAGVLRRFDTLSSCALGAVVALGVAGLLDFDWHLSFLGLLGGWVAGLATSALPEMPLVV